MTSSGANDESNQQMLRSMIFSFRVSELQMLLGYAGRNKNGKKEDLQSRALDLVKIRSTPMQAKIRQIYKASQLENMNQGGPGAGQQPHLGGYLPSHYMNMYTAAALSLQQQQQQQSRNPYSTGSATGYPQLAPSAYGNSGYPLINPSVQTPAAATSAGHHLHQVPRNPDVKFVRLPFYDVQAELVKPISMVATSNSRLQEANCSFLLTPQQATDIASNRDTSTGPQADFMYQVQLRFCQLTPDNRDKSKELNDEFPPSISVQVNGKLAPLPNPIPTNKPGVEPKRPPRPVNITPLCKLSPILPNNITVKWASDMGKSWVVGIWLVVKLNSNDLLERLKKKGTRNPEFTRGLIVDKLNDDDEVATESLKVSVACPLGKMRMKVPCRPSTCSHLQCFDAGLFLQMNERKPTWNCPVCDSKAVYDTLLIDGYFQEVLSSKSLVPDENEIILDSDGTWKPVPKDDEKTKPPSSLPPSGSQTTKTNATNAKDDDVECIDLSGDEGESNGTALPPLPPGAPPPPPPYPPTVNQPPPPPGLPEEIECIDLD